MMLFCNHKVHIPSLFIGYVLEDEGPERGYKVRLEGGNEGKGIGMKFLCNNSIKVSNRPMLSRCINLVQDLIAVVPLTPGKVV